MNETLLPLIDKAIAHCAGRDIVSASELTDMLLDMRLLITTESEVPA
jgi:hypothetical protein